MSPQISIIVPLYNESKVFAMLIHRLQNLMDSLPVNIEVVMVDDGSRDDTALQMIQTSLADKRFQSVILSRNFGHQSAVSAGMKVARGTEAVFIIDGDLQDPPELLGEFYTQLKAGYEVIYAVRKKRKESFFKKIAYNTFYRLLKKISYIDIPLDSGDFSLLSRKVVDILNKMPEESRYIRGMRAWAGFKQIGVAYERQERQAGESKYSWQMLWKLAYNGIFNFSEFPIKFITNLGFISIAFSLIYLADTIIRKFMYGTVPQGFTALLFAIILFSGVQLLSLGIIGEYVLRIFFQVKNRPLFIISKQIIEGEEV